MIDESMGMLKLRLSFLATAIKTARDNRDDRIERPGKNGIPSLIDQQRILSARYRERVREERRREGIPEPEPIVVELDALSIRTTAPALARRQHG